MSMLKIPDSLQGDEKSYLLCGSCEKHSAIIAWDHRYSGFRGYCQICKNNWPES